MIQLPSYIGNGLEKLRTYLVSNEHCQAVVPVEPVGQITGTLGALNAAVEADTSISNTVVVAVTGTFNLTLAFEGTLDGTNWLPLPAMNHSNRAMYTALAATVAAMYTLPTMGLAKIRVRASAYTSGSAAIRLARSISPPFMNQAMPTSVKAAQSTTGCATLNHHISSATDNAKVVRSSSSAVYHADISNNNTTWCYLKLYDKATTPLANDVPRMVIGIAPNSSRTANFGDIGVYFTAGLGMRIVRGAADNDATFPAAGQVVVALQFYG